MTLKLVVPSVAAAWPSAAVAAGSAALALDGALGRRGGAAARAGCGRAAVRGAARECEGDRGQDSQVGPVSLSVRMYVLPDEPASR